ncbi:IS3 family transposase [Carnobacterium maltaromaticum]|uniref:IS3 family transposase n=1 Tax=Carnobacterium maltaromaticum TaxID=2751 RepID=UPI003B985402
MSKRKRRTYSEAFKKQMVDLYHSGKSRQELIREYELTPSAFDKWLLQQRTSGSFKEKDNLTPEQVELKELRKQNKQLEMENDILKQATLIFGRKFQVIHMNCHKYAISAMCRALNISRSTYYYEVKENSSEAALEMAVVNEFYNSRQNYGTRKLKAVLKPLGFVVSRKRISRMMKKFNLISNYTKAHYKKKRAAVNSSLISNVLNRNFNQEQPLKVVITDLTYIRVGSKWHYICLIVDLFNREIIGHSSGPHKNAALVKQAFSTIQRPLSKICLFHTDRGNEFDNRMIDQLLAGFGIQRSLSTKGCPYDNAVAESTYKALKVEFVYPNTFNSQQQLSAELSHYVHWWNCLRVHGTLRYQTPVSYRLAKQPEGCLK